MVKHARPPHPLRPDPRALALVPASAKGPPKRRKDEILPDDDPLVLIDALDATGGVDGTRPRMTPVAAEAFRVLCSMSPLMRTLPRLREKLTVEWGKAPNRKTLEDWSSRYAWQEMLREYDRKLRSLRLWNEEQERRKAGERQARMGRWMSNKAITRMEAMFNEAEAEEQRAATAPRHDGGDDKGKKKKPTLNGLHALAFAAKTGFEMERVALGMPTVVTTGNLQTENLMVHTDGSGMTLDEWRRQLALERGTPTGVAGAHAGDAPKLPAPRLREEDVDALPDGWSSALTGQIVEADADPTATTDDHEEHDA